MTTDLLEWIERWYAAQCDGDWEHGSGIRITTLDNPGWHVSIALEGTELEGLDIPYAAVEVTEQDWYGFSVKGSKYEAGGDPGKLRLLLQKFRQIAEEFRDNQARSSSTALGRHPQQAKN